MGNTASDLESECASMSQDFYDEEEGNLGYNPKEKVILSPLSSTKAPSSPGVIEMPQDRTGSFKEYIFDYTIDELEKNLSEIQLDDVIDAVVPEEFGEKKTKVITPYKPQRIWLWRQWTGTIWQHGYKHCLFMMIYSSGVFAACHYLEDNRLEGTLVTVAQGFKYLMTLSFFILTFFLNQSYGLWRDVYNTCRGLQGSTDDLGMLAATHAARVDGKYTSEAEDTLNDIAMTVKIFHIFVYASKSRRFRALQTNRALKRMTERGIISPEICEAIMKSKIFHGDRVFGTIEWLMIKFQAGVDDGSLKDAGDLFMSHVLDTGLLLRKQFGSFRGTLEARIPLAYAHFVQIMVDTLLFIAPVALYKDLLAFTIPTVGIMTIFFGGLLDISKVMLDPLDNEDYCDGVIDINVGVFIRQANYGAIKFKQGAETLPVGWIKKTA